MCLLVISTGGTIGALPHDDPRHAPDIALFPQDDRDFIRDFLEAYGASGLRYMSAGFHDSKDIDDSFRRKLVELVEVVPEQRILIAHGTDSLLKTAEYFSRTAKIFPALASKTILFTGAMVPLSNGPESDGFLNLAFSLDYLMREKVEPGISFVLCDYTDRHARTGWASQLYLYESDRYVKFFNPQDSRYNRMIRIS